MALLYLTFLLSTHALIYVNSFQTSCIEGSVAFRSQRHIPDVRRFHSARIDLSAAFSDVIPTNASVGGQDLSRHVSILDKSLNDLTSRGLYERMGIDPLEGYQAICQNEKFVLISHNTEDDPIYNFGNVACLRAFVRSWEELCITPSRESVVVRSVDEKLRNELMSKVTSDGFVEGATGIRVTGDGKFIRLIDAVVSNIIIWVQVIYLPGIGLLHCFLLISLQNYSISN